MPLSRSNRIDRRRRVMLDAVAADSEFAVESVRAALLEQSQGSAQETLQLHLAELTGQPCLVLILNRLTEKPSFVSILHMRQDEQGVQHQQRCRLPMRLLLKPFLLAVSLGLKSVHSCRG